MKRRTSIGLVRHRRPNSNQAQTQRSAAASLERQQLPVTLLVQGLVRWRDFMSYAESAFKPLVRTLTHMITPNVQSEEF